jgi:hypothetical protein
MSRYSPPRREAHADRQGARGFPGALESGGQVVQQLVPCFGRRRRSSAARSKLSIASAVIPALAKDPPEKRGGHEAQARRARGGLKRRDAFVESCPPDAARAPAGTVRRQPRAPFGATASVRSCAKTSSKSPAASPGPRRGLRLLDLVEYDAQVHLDALCPRRALGGDSSSSMRCWKSTALRPSSN